MRVSGYDVCVLFAMIMMVMHDIMLLIHRCRSLCREIVDIYEEDKGHGKDTAYLMPLVRKIAEFDMTHHAEAEACDLLLEVMIQYM